MSTRIVTGDELFQIVDNRLSQVEPEVMAELHVLCTGLPTRYLGMQGTEEMYEIEEDGE